MTYKEIILNRILDKKTVSEIQSWWADNHVPDCQDKDYELTDVGWNPFKKKIVIKIWD